MVHRKKKAIKRPLPNQHRPKLELLKDHSMVPRVPPVENHIVNLYEMPEYAHLAPRYRTVFSRAEHKNCKTCGVGDPVKEEVDSGLGAEDDVAQPVDPSRHVQMSSHLVTEV